MRLKDFINHLMTSEIVYIIGYDHVFADETLYVGFYQFVVKMFLGNRSCCEKEKELGGFRGPKEFAPRINGRQYYKNTYICGGVDFIFGSATAYFENCTLESLPEGGGYVTGGG